MTFRVIARLDVKPPNLVKGVHLEGFRRLGTPAEFARRYYSQGADEIHYQDVVASLYERNGLAELVTQTAQDVFVPVAVGGGIRTVEDAARMIRAGSDKVCVNTAAVRDPSVLSRVAEALGRQAVVLGVEAKRAGDQWIVMSDAGREHTGREVSRWVTEAQDYGIGEILLTSIDREGTGRGFDLDLLSLVRSVASVPIIMHGGLGEPLDAARAAEAGADGVAVASLLHYGRSSIDEIKTCVAEHGFEVRPCV